MKTSYHLHINDLNESLLASIKAAFKDRTVEIVVSDEVKNSDEDLRNTFADEESFNFWQAEEEDLYQDYLTKNA